MNHQNMSHITNRRGFLKNAVLGAGAFAGLPSLDLPLLATDSGSRIKALELLVLKHKPRAAAGVESHLQHRRRWICGFSGSRLCPGTGWCREEAFDWSQSLCGGSHLVEDATGWCSVFASDRPGLCPVGLTRTRNRQARLRTACRHGAGTDHGSTTMANSSKQHLENEDAWRALGRELA